MTQDTDKYTKVNVRDYAFHPLSLRVWHGMSLDSWLRVMSGKWHLVSPRRYPLALTITLFGITNLFLKGLTKLFYDRKVDAVEIEPDPIFVIGHWRSGTTWLHNMLMMDPRHAAPSQGACFTPEFFLLTQKVFAPVIRKITPETRPMDNVKLDPDQAEEDEIAICLSGAQSPFAGLLFPSEEPVLIFNPVNYGEKECRIWRRKWLKFLKSVQLINPGKRLVLKSPTHTLRIEEILRHFPKAKFIHIRRDPYRILMSNDHTSKAMAAVLALQDRLPERMDDVGRQVDRFVAFHEKLEKERPLIPNDQIVNIRYEDLRTDTVGTLKTVYETLDLGDFGEIEPELRNLEKSGKSYKNNVFELDDDLKTQVDAKFAKFFDLYGYLPMDQRSASAE